MNTANSNRTVWVNTHRVTLAEFEADVSYDSETLSQGRDCRKPVPRISPMAGTPSRSEQDNTLRAGFWAFCAAVLLTAACAVVLANWPN